MKHNKNYRPIGYYVRVKKNTFSKENYVICKDGKLRDTVLFGTHKTCLKVYKSLGWAKKAARKLVQGGLCKNAITQYIYEDQRIDIHGNITGI